MSKDFSNGYEKAAKKFMAARSTNGRATIQKWAASLPYGGCVIDIGAGSGDPLTSVLIEEGLAVSAIDASSAMVAAFKKRFPDVEIMCEPAESSRFFDKTFDAALAVGVIFLLSQDRQRELISRISHALKPGGRLLFSAPKQMCSWNDVLTGQLSLSLGIEEYRQILASVRLTLIQGYVDEGETYYYEAQKY